MPRGPRENDSAFCGPGNGPRKSGPRSVTISAMDRNALTKEQAKKVAESIGPALTYLDRLQTRMNDTGFPPPIR